MKILKAVLISIFFFLASRISAQDVAGTIIKLKNTIRYPEVAHFYSLTDNKPAWVDYPERQAVLFDLLARSADYGLNEKDYQYNSIQKFKAPTVSTVPDPIETDIRITDAAIHFFTELKIGNSVPYLSYPGFMYKPSAEDVPVKLHARLVQNNLGELPAILQPKSKEFLAMIDLLRRFNTVTRDPAFKDIKVTSNLVGSSNKNLLSRLHQLGLLDSLSGDITNKQVVETLKKSARLFDVLPDGQLRSTTLAALNIPISRRMEELKLAINWLRWLNQLKSESVAILDIPAAYLFVYGKDSMILESKVVVGKPSTPTPILSSTMSEVILYPYWHVPNKIAVKELLPNIKQNLKYLEENNFQVLNKQGKIMEPRSINWQSLGPGNFPYTIRQSTGCDNSLGIVKFNFYNPYSVYLHDTPIKNLFSYNKRYYSHGCMRVENFAGLAHFLLGSNRIALDTLLEKGCVNQKSPVVVPVEEQLPLFIIYSTLWYDKEGALKFYDDVYDKLPLLTRKQTGK